MAGNPARAWTVGQPRRTRLGTERTTSQPNPGDDAWHRICEGPLVARSTSDENPLQTFPGFDDLKQRARSVLLSSLVRSRLFFVPLPILVASTIVLFDDMWWRRVLLGAVVVGLVGISLIEFFRLRHTGVVTERAVIVNAVITVAGHTVAALGTGGLWSPIVFASPILTLLLGVATSSRGARLVLASELALVWCGTALVLVGGPGVVPALFRPSSGAGFTWPHVLLACGVLTMLNVLAFRVGGVMSGTFGAQMREALEARDASLVVHRERASELTLLSAEIAHELKNPLASVKGLATLLAKDASGRSAEHLTVLRREVDRMEGVLNEFLNFSRPLVPLSLERVDLRVVAAVVGALHQGVAAERGVRLLIVESAPMIVLCDARKVQQVLINLVQNAIDASPRGREVRVDFTTTHESVSVRVSDEGAGVAPEIAARVFEPGVTTKTRGSGLGLTVARGLARQHGGDLALRAQPERGTIAELTVPRDGPDAPSVAGAA